MVEKNSILTIRFANEDDIDVILKFIKELAEYEQMLDQVIATKEILYKSLFIEKSAEVIIAEISNEAIGFALFFHNFSTFLGKSGIYLEDLYIKPEFRSNGYGKSLLSFLAKLAQQRKCGRLEWWCLDDNKPSVEFYTSLGAEPMKDWTVYRMSGEKLKKLGAYKG